MGDAGDLLARRTGSATTSRPCSGTDLVFIDPVSTGFSRGQGEKSAEFHGFGGDIDSVGEVIRL